MQKQKVNSSFRRWLRQQREKMNLSQRKLASLAGISPGYIARIERGYSQTPSANVMMALAKALDVSLDEIPKPTNRTMSFTQISNNNPRSALLFRNILSKMSEVDPARNIDRLEKRLGLFNEDLDDVVDAFVKLLTGETEFCDSDGFTRPVGHYFLPYSPEIDSWVSAERVFDDL